MKKTVLYATILAVFGFAMIMGVSASSYTSTLSLGKGAHHTGEPRQYTAGNYNVSVAVSSFTKVDGLSYTKLAVTKDSQYDSFSSLMTVKDMISKKTTYNFGFGNAEQSTTTYSFSTRVDNYNYGGVKSNKVVMSS